MVLYDHPSCLLSDLVFHESPVSLLQNSFLIILEHKHIPLIIQGPCIPLRLSPRHLHCGSPNEMPPKVLGIEYVVPTQVGGTIWIGLESVALLKEICHWRLALRFKWLAPVLVLSLFFLPEIEIWALRKATVPFPHYRGFLSLWNHRPKKVSSLCCLSHGVLL